LGSSLTATQERAGLVAPKYFSYTLFISGTDGQDRRRSVEGYSRSIFGAEPVGEGAGGRGDSPAKLSMDVKKTLTCEERKRSG
jgi:hypothetical protein